MQIHNGIENLPVISNAAVTIGTFDGVHLAHREILAHIRSAASAIKGSSVVITFWPHPRMVLQPGNHDLRLLSTPDEKASLIAEDGIDHLIIIPFTLEFSNWSAEKFVQDVLIGKINAKKIIIGYDHHFGNKREGNLEFLMKNSARFGFEVEEITRQLIDDSAISSTNIRQALLDGDPELASRLMGHYYSFSGEVIHGNQLGRKIGFPTANIRIKEDYKLIPAVGVYAVKVQVSTLPDQSSIFKAMLNIGFRPTVNGHGLTIEAHLFDFDSEIYGQTITIQLIRRLRNEQKFENIDGLIRQLQLDKEKSIELLKDLRIFA